MICPNCKTELTDTRLVLDDRTVKTVGEMLWQDKHTKASILPMVGGFAGVIIALQIDRFSNIAGFVVGLLSILGSIYAFRRYVLIPKKAAGEQFLKDWRK